MSLQNFKSFELLFKTFSIFALKHDMVTFIAWKQIYFILNFSSFYKKKIIRRKENRFKRKKVIFQVPNFKMMRNLKVTVPCCHSKRQGNRNVDAF